MMKNETLATINQKILAEGESLPAVTLRDGTRVQTGTFATLMHNIDLYNKGERGDIENEMRLAVETLGRIGLFTLFIPDEWMNTNNQGRFFVGSLAKALGH